MAEKELKARIIHKHDTEANWNKATNFIPKESEFIVYDMDDTHNYFRLKIGDGVTDVINLPFYGGSLEHILDGIADGSIRTSNSAPEDANYKLGTDAFAEGKGTKASGNFSHAEGFSTTASAAYSHAEGRGTTASGTVSHAEGTDTVASGARSHAGGYGTIAKGENQTAIGKYNVEDVSNKYAFIIGNGTSSTRKNALTVDWSGNVESNGKKLATEEYVNANGGKIGSISVNGSAQEIVDKNVNITIPTKTSDLTNDSNFLSSIPDEYITEEELNLKNYQNNTEVQNKINTEINKLNKNDSAVVGQYVSSVSEENGIITVSRENLPQQIDYTVTITESTPEGFAKVYNIKQTSTGLNATINIPKDMVVSSGKVETYTLSGEWGLAGTYLVLTLANATSDKVYINVGNLIEYVTSGSTADDQIQIEIDNEHKVTAILKNSSVTKEQLDTNLQNELNSKVNAEYVEQNGSKITKILVNGIEQTINEKSVDLDVPTNSEFNTHINNSNIHITSEERTKWNNKASTSVVTTTSNGLMIASDKSKLDGIATGANNYVHPTSHPASIIVEDSTHRFVTDTEKSVWSEKEVFIATYGVTTNAEIEAAYQSGKAGFCKKGSYLFVLVSRLDENTHVFSSVDTASSSIAVCSSNTWSVDYTDLPPKIGDTDIGKVLSVDKYGSPIWKDIKPTITTVSLLASNWDSSAKTYSLESEYPNANYDIEVALDSTATSEQAEAFNGAQIVGSATSNTIKAYGDVPIVDIPIILKVVTK